MMATPVGPRLRIDDSEQSQSRVREASISHKAVPLRPSELIAVWLQAFVPSESSIRGSRLPLLTSFKSNPSNMANIIENMKELIERVTCLMER